MKISFRNRNIFEDIGADTIVLPIDGAGPNMYGNIACRFLDSIKEEEDDVQMLFAPPLYHPLGASCAWGTVEHIDSTPYKWMCFIGILSHKENANHERNLIKAIDDLLTTANSGDLGWRLAIPIPSGGHRVPPKKAIEILVHMVKEQGTVEELIIVERNTEKYRELLPHFQKLTNQHLSVTS
jgi:hypothetical protein